MVSQGLTQTNWFSQRYTSFHRCVQEVQAFSWGLQEFYSAKGNPLQEKQKPSLC